MRGSCWGAGRTGLRAAVVLTVGLMTGCSARAPGPPGASVDTCYAFGVRALRAHVIVARMPPECAGLDQARVNLAVTRAVREVTGSRPKAAARRLAEADSGYLARLVRAVPPAGAVQGAAAAAPRPPGGSGRLTALVAWIAAAGAGFGLLAGRLASRGSRRHSRAVRVPPLPLGHAALAMAGLGLWIAFAAVGGRVLAWLAVGVLLLTAGLGLAVLAAALPGPAALPAPAAWPGPAALPGPAARPGPAEPSAAGPAARAAPTRPRLPVLVIAGHSALAVLTILLVLLAAISVR